MPLPYTGESEDEDVVDSTLYANNAPGEPQGDQGREGQDPEATYEPVGMGTEAGSSGQGPDGAYDQATDGGIDAEAPIVCTYRSPKGRPCKHLTAGGGAMHCHVHTCPVPSCTNPKSSQQKTCATCTNAVAGAGGAGGAQQQQEEAHYMQPVANNPDYSPQPQPQAPEYLSPVAVNPHYASPETDEEEAEDI